MALMYACASSDLDESRGTQETQISSVIVTSIWYQWNANPKQVRVVYRLTKCEEVDLIYATTKSRTLARQGGSAIPHLTKLSRHQQ